jgi:xanthine/uracil permease
MKFNYGVDDKLPFLDNILFGLQWFLISIPNIIVPGKIVAYFHFGSDVLMQTLYLQKLFFVSFIMFIAQTFFGHRLPLISGPAIVLMVAATSTSLNYVANVYNSIALCGLIVFVLSYTKYLSQFLKIFTKKIIAVVLLLISFIILPGVIDLIVKFPDGVNSAVKLYYAIIFILLIFIFTKILKGIWQNTVIVWAMIFGSIIYIYLFKPNMSLFINKLPIFSNFFSNFNVIPTFDIGIFIMVAICFFGLMINDVGAMEVLNELTNQRNKYLRIKSGIRVTGAINILSGFLGVIGSCNFPTSAGVVAATKCASRYTLVPCAILFLILAISPASISIMNAIPPIIIGTVFLYILCLIFSSGLYILFEDGKIDFNNCLIIAFPVLVGTLIAFLPDKIITLIPTIIRPVLGSGFVVGVLTAIIMEHIVFRNKDKEKE